MEIFHDALEKPSSERRQFVRSASSGNMILQAEVERLLLADEKAESFLESPLTMDSIPPFFLSSTPPFEPGDVLKHRFRIDRHVGEGGMGHVFEAFDLELNVRVALKVIRSDIAGIPGVLDFFRREVRIARTITHPNACRTYDFDKGTLGHSSSNTAEFSFLTMEFLAGETLGARLKRVGPFTTEEAFDIARQVAMALDAAHERGIIHRDIKPANIMLVPQSSASDSQFRAVVTDFGLARIDAQNQALARSSVSQGNLLGTLAYMAPEQLAPGSDCSGAADVYAFGLVLFEMVTGRRAFPSDNLLGGISQRIAGPLPSPKALAPQLPQQWEDVIQTCLQIDPGARFQTAGAAIAAFEHPAQVPAGAGNPRRQPAPSPSRSRPGSSRLRTLAFSAIFLCAVALILLAFRFYKRDSNDVAPGALVYLAHVRNQTSDPLLDNVTELLRVELSQSPQINLLDQGRAGDLLQQITKIPEAAIDQPTARHIAMRAGAVRVIFPSVTQTPGICTLTIEIQQPDNTPARARSQWKKSFSWKAPAAGTSRTEISPDLLNAIRTASGWIRRNVGESAADLARLDAPANELTTASWEALTEYENAERASMKSNPEEAVQALQRAVQIDPQFALAYARLGDQLASMRRSPEAFDAYDHALNAELERRLTRREHDRIKGMYAVDTGDMETAELAFRDYTNFYENDPLGWAYRSFPLETLGRTEEAVSVLRQAARLMPKSSFPTNELIACMLTLGRYREADELIASLRAGGFTDFARIRKGQLQFLEGQIEAAAASFKALQDSPSASMRYFGHSFLARLLAEQGNTTAAIEQLTQALTSARAAKDASNQARFLLDRAWLEAGQNNAKASLDDVDDAIALIPSVRNILYAANIIGSLPKFADARIKSRILRSLDHLEKQLPPNQDGTFFKLAGLRVRGEISAASHDWNQALSFAQHAAAIDFPATSREYLGRASVAAAAHAANPTARQALLNQALEAYGVVALHPALVWALPEGFPPGLYSNQLLAYRDCAKALRNSDAVAHAELALKTIHPH